MLFISDYDDAMFIKVGSHPNFGVQNLYFAITIILAFGLVFLASINELWHDHRAALQFLISGFFLFALYKHAFVRADNHIAVFVLMVSTELAILVLFLPSPIKERLSSVFLVSLILTFGYVSKFYTYNFFQSKYLGIKHYYHQATNAAYIPDPKAPLEEHRLPQEILDQIENRSTDILPWDISYIYVNDLAYTPRPVIQSYAAYNYDLDMINANKYLGESAPDFLLFRTGDIDGRHPFFTESITKLAILRNYEIAGAYNDFVLLEKSPQLKSSTIVDEYDKQAQLGRFIFLGKTPNLLLLTADIEYNLIGKISSVFYQPPILLVTVEYVDGNQQTFRAIKPIVSSGVLVNHLPESVEDLQTFFSSGGSKGPRITKIKFSTPDKWGFKSQFNYHIQEIMLGEPKSKWRDFRVPQF